MTTCCETGACCCGGRRGRCACEHPLVSVITPTWRRRTLLLKRCLPSVYAQDYPNVEHIVVSDGPDPELAETMATMVGQPAGTGPWSPRLVYAELPEHPEGKHWGHHARQRGLEIARGDYIAYLDDDDLYLPWHCSTLVSALGEHPEAGFAYTQMEWADRSYRIGREEPLETHIGTPMIMHRRDVLEHGSWDEAGEYEDWRLVERWLKAGVNWHFVPKVTIMIWPSLSALGGDGGFAGAEPGDHDDDTDLDLDGDLALADEDLDEDLELDAEPEPQL